MHINTACETTLHAKGITTNFENHENYKHKQKQEHN